LRTPEFEMLMNKKVIKFKYVLFKREKKIGSDTCGTDIITV